MKLNRDLKIPKIEIKILRVSLVAPTPKLLSEQVIWFTNFMLPIFGQLPHYHPNWIKQQEIISRDPLLY